MSKNSKQDSVRAAMRNAQRNWLGVLDFGVPSRGDSRAWARRPGRPAASGFVAMP